MQNKTSWLKCLLVLCLLFPGVSAAASKAEIDAKVTAALKTFYEKSPSGKILAEQAVGMLVFPEIVKAGLGVGGEFGEGAMLSKGKTIGYYNTAAASIGLQFGAQVKSVIILFMNDKVLKDFQASDGWEAGVDGSVAIATVGAGGEIDTKTAQEPIIGFVFSNKGLMYNLTLEGSKITKIKK